VAKTSRKVVSQTQKGDLSVPEVTKKDLELSELRERLSRELDSLAQLERTGVRPYKLVLIVKRTRKKPLGYKLVVERGD